jgi:YYY domain-containing protein
VGDSWLQESIRWYGLLVLVTWGLAPLSRWLLSRMADRGASVARPLALLALVWPVWFLASVSPLPYTGLTLWVSFFAIAAIGWAMAFRFGWIEPVWLRSLSVVEVVSLVIFFGYVLLRGYTPQIVYTEKAMDIAFLTSTSRVTDMPPADPWFAGESINYYYLGYLIHGTLSRLSEIPAWTGYNLALGTTASMAIVAAGGVAWNISRPPFGRRVGSFAALLAGFLVVMAGNLHAAVELIRDRRAAIDQWWWGTIGWGSSRIVVDPGSPQPETINEFPWFSLLLGDLHPHLTALPFTILVLMLAVSAVTYVQDADGNRWSVWGALVVTGVVAGSLYPLNSLDFPTYLVVVVGAFGIAGGLTQRTLIRAAVVVVAAVVAWMPFIVTFVPFAGGDESNLPGWLRDLPVLPRLLTSVSWYGGERTSVQEFLTVFGFPWLIALLYLGLAIALEVRERGRPTVPRWAILVAVAAVLVAVAVPVPVAILAGVPLVGALWLIVRRWEGRQLYRVAPPALFAAGFGLILLTEFFYVQDAFNGRYNTLFKVYYQVWTLFGIGAAVGVALLLANLKGRRIAQLALAAGLVLGIAAVSVYPVVATIQWTRVHGEREWRGLDGAEFLGNHSADDLAAIRWLADNAESDDVVIEAPGCSYTINGAVPTGRIAAFTGVANIVGWGFHQVQWRGGQPELLNQITPRQEHVAAIYADPSSDLVDQYEATLLYVGSFERYGAGPNCEIAGPFPTVNDPEFPGPGWEEVFASGDARIYRRSG